MWAIILAVIPGVVAAQEPSMSVVSNSSSFVCSDEYLVVGEDYATFEVDVSGNNSDYTYDLFDRPRFRIQTLVTKNGSATVKDDMSLCEPFGLPQDGFCVKRDLTNTTNCSCEVVGPQVYRVKAVYRIEDDVNGTNGRIQLLWPDVRNGDIAVFYYLPEVRGTGRGLVFPLLHDSLKQHPKSVCRLSYRQGYRSGAWTPISRGGHWTFLGIRTKTAGPFPLVSSTDDKQQWQADREAFALTGGALRSCTNNLHCVTPIQTLQIMICLEVFMKLGVSIIFRTCPPVYSSTMPRRRLWLRPSLVHYSISYLVGNGTDMGR
ncbi:hypothetical protein PoB_007311100 [Plakobranchus ocellatus]|uniref:Uncharacterized protein n=1 Tax=Plakobranchus ocellatus TaxID=259542 RepID=A0AAV4DRY3_9GAST|nr:hypothetical protein PoB_007311100 [Plakobranchus ocellatus]